MMAIMCFTGTSVFLSMRMFVSEVHLLNWCMIPLAH